jgi:hypothetical protein
MNNKLTQNYEVLKNTIKDNNLKKLFYWKNINFENKYKITKEKYLIFKPWNGGFNNVKMSFEIALVIAYRLNRILVLPSSDTFNIDHLKNARKSALKLEKEIPNFIKIECAKENKILPREVIHEMIYERVKKIIR